MQSCISIVLCAAAVGDDASGPVSDEAQRLAALEAIFPGMQISVDPNQKIDYSWPKKPAAGKLFFPDALVEESVYSVTGRATNKAESWASDNLITRRHSTARQVRFKLFRWPNESDLGLLAILQYHFPRASPAMSCPSIGLLVHLVKNASWTVKDQYLLETVHHHFLQGIRLLDLTGQGADELVNESNAGGAGTAESNLQVFDLSSGRFDELLNTASRLQYYMTENYYSQILDISRTRESHGQRFCFSKTTLFEEGKPFQPPRVTHPCYKRSAGVDSETVRERNKLLLPSP
jgi:hypothetical protein